MIDVPETDPKPRSRKVCASCEATPQGCDSNYWLRSRRCCDACTGDHDTTTTTTKENTP